MANLPPGISPEQMAAFVKFFASLPTERVMPSGTLQPNQIRGVNPRYSYVYQEYPKALYPPPVKVNNAREERDFRSHFHMLLPWNPNDEVQRDTMEEYYARQEYPKAMSPPMLVAYNVQEEEAITAAWRTTDLKVGASVIYPRWMFHVHLDPQLVTSRDAEIALGQGWYSTPGEAVLAARGEERPAPASEVYDGAGKAEHDALMERALELEIPKADTRWSDERLRSAIARAEREKAPREKV